MKTLAVATGELLQRLREPAFMVLLVILAAGTTYLAPSPHDPYSTLIMGKRPIFGGTALAGTSAGLDFGVLSGFFLIFALGTGFARDDRTRLGELLRSQPIATLQLVFGRVLASWMLGSVLAVGGMLLLGATLAFREGLAAFDPWGYARNFLLLALPCTWFVASCAGLLDIVLGRWRGLLVAAGIVGYVTLLSLAGSAVAVTGEHRGFVVDFGGVVTVEDAFWRDFSPQFGKKAVLDAGLTVEEKHGAPLRWAGLQPDAAAYAGRALVAGEALAIAFLAALCYRRRAGVSSRRSAAVESVRSRGVTRAPIAAPRARRIGTIRRSMSETFFRLRKNLWLTGASAGLFAFALFGAHAAAHWVIALAILLPLFWIRTFNDSLRPHSLDETFAALPGGRGGDFAAKTATLAVTCVLPLAGLLIGNPGDPMTWLAASLGVTAEIAWLTLTAWSFRAELLALAVVALWWYVAALNHVPPPIDFAGLWSAPLQTLALDGIFAAACFALSAAVLRRRGGQGSATVLPGR